MLEIRNVSKTYRAKSGVAVKALDRISLTFPEKGMVFLLGKSGSGKSTLLNVLGGLDTFDADGGEVIIKGRTSKDFRRSDFDAYRNTFVGFVFQEYNILDEFTVGANIALALQLQGKRADSAAINALLEQVDLAGYGHRKPNELSGGQKQRIAIARALIKNPEIIMADEPTGALDSTTGEQVFETLKKLSEEKLVLVVSHDRDFAERFGDRIIELSDGHVISDMTLTRGNGATQGLTTIGDDMIRIRRGYTLTAEDLAMINAYLAKGDRDVILSKNEKLNGEVCAAAGISDEVGATEQRPTGKVETRTYRPEETKFIRSHLPLRNAFKMGVGGMKRRPVRLIFTILLSFIAFALFGLADTMAAYDRNTTIIDSISDSSMPALAVSVKLRSEYTSYDENGNVDYSSIEYYQSDALSDEDLRTLEARTGKKFYPVYNGSVSASTTVGLESTILNSAALRNRNGETFWRERSYNGFIEMNEEIARELGIHKIAGDFPQTTNEIMITKYHFDMWKQGGMILADGTRLSAEEVSDQSILGKTITVPVYNKSREDRTFQIVGILDTGLSTSGYEALLPDCKGERLKEKKLEALYNRLNAEISGSYHALLFGAPGLFDTFPKKISNGGGQSVPGIFYYVENGSAYLQEVKMTRTDNGTRFIVNGERVASSKDAEAYEILWREAGKNTMGADDLVIPLYALFNLTTDDLGLTKPRGSAEDLIPALRNDVEGWTYQRLFAERDQLRNTYNSRVPDDRKESANAFAAFLTEKMNERFGVTYTVDDWEMLLQKTTCYFYEEGAQSLSVTLSCFEWSNDNLTYVESLEYFRFVEAQYDAFAAKAEETDSPFRAFLTTYRSMTVTGGNRILTSADAGYHGYLVASAMLYLRGAAIGAYPQAEADIKWAKELPDIGLDALAAVRYADYADILGVELTPEQLEMLHYSDTRGNCGEADNVYNALFGESQYNNTSLNTLFRLSVALKFATQNDETIRAALEDLNNPFTKYVIERTSSYIYKGDEQVPQLPAGRDDALLRFFWTLAYLLNGDDQYRGAFAVDVRTDEIALGEDFLAAHLSQIPDLTMDFIVQKYKDGGESTEEPVAGLTGMKVTGYIRPTELSSTDTVIFSDAIYAEAKRQEKRNNGAQYGNGGYGVSKTGYHDSGRYAFALMPMKDVSREALGSLTAMHYDETGEFGFRMTNEVVETMDNWGDMIGTMRKVFLWIGLGFALFAALMMLNFVSATVTDKKREIGILRAVGARSADVFLIFFAEAFVVAMLNFVLAAIATGVATVYINLAIRQELGLALTLLHFGVRQVGLIFAVSLVVAVLGTLLPASKIAKKTPVDAMRDK